MYVAATDCEVWEEASGLARPERQPLWPGLTGLWFAFGAGYVQEMEHWCAGEGQKGQRRGGGRSRRDSAGRTDAGVLIPRGSPLGWVLPRPAKRNRRCYHAERGRIYRSQGLQDGRACCRQQQGAGGGQWRHSSGSSISCWRVVTQGAAADAS